MKYSDLDGGAFDNMINNTIDLWEHMKTQGGINEKNYDDDFLTNLRNILGGTNNDSIRNIIEKKEITIESFISKFFYIAKPYSQMYTDILKMFEQADAQIANKNLEIDFDFENNEKFSFDIEHFKQYKEVVRKISYYTEEIDFSKINLWVMCEFLIIRKKLPVDLDDREELWISEYMKGEQWPNVEVKCPKTRYADLDTVINKMWRIWELYIYEYKSLFKSPKEAQRNYRNYSMIKDHSISDHWPVFFLKKLNEFVNRFSMLNEEEKKRIADITIKNLKTIGIAPVILKKKNEVMVSELKEFLMLPTWKHRYELYSVWVGAKIMSSFDPVLIKYHVEEGKLSFSFGGSQIASINESDPEIQIWAELRTEWKNEKKKQRKSRNNCIQPDYSLVVGSADDIESTLVVIECKQYKKPNRKNFEEALEDYADGRPNSDVVLVNYGKIPIDLIDRVKEIPKERLLAFGQFIPQSSDITEFQKIIKKRLEKELRIQKGMKIDVSKELVIILEWGKTPRDLDLELSIRANNTKISYWNKQGMGCQYEEDKQEGFGPEFIKISKFINSQYEIGVSNYSKDADLKDSQAKVIIKQNELEYEIRISSEFSCAEYWKVATIDTEIGIIEISQTGI